MTTTLPSPPLAALLADAVLLAHLAIVLFNVGGLLLILAGNRLGWRWVNRWWFRAAHLAAIAVVVGQAWLGITCPLTTLESWLRALAGSAPYHDGFIAHWVQRILFYRLPRGSLSRLTRCSACWWRGSGGDTRRNAESRGREGCGGHFSGFSESFCPVPSVGWSQTAMKIG